MTSRLTESLACCLLSLCSQNEVTPYDVASFYGYQDVCDLLQNHTNSETDKEMTEVRLCVCEVVSTGHCAYVHIHNKTIIMHTCGENY